jgi:hypothetical protein
MMVSIGIREVMSQQLTSSTSGKRLSFCPSESESFRAIANAGSRVVADDNLCPTGS